MSNVKPNDIEFDDVVRLARVALRQLRLERFREYMVRINENYESMTDKDFEDFAQLQVLMWNAAEQEDKIRNSKNGTQKET